MKYCIHEFWFYIRKKPVIMILTILIGALGSMLMICSGRFVKKAQSENEEYNRIYENGKYSTLTDQFFDEVERELKAKPEYWNILKEFNTIMHSSDMFEYLEIRQQFSEVFDYRGKDENLSGYERGNVKREYQRGTDIFSNIKAIWLGKEVFSHFNLTVSEGNLFHAEDFDYYFGKEKDVLMPILMGSNFRGDYQVGDVIDVNNFVMRGKVKVIGFLEEGCSVYSIDNMIPMDRFLIFPMLDINDEPKNGEERSLFRSLYYEKNNGEIYSEVDENEIQDFVAIECERLGIAGGYLVCGANNQPTANLGIGLDNIVKIIEYFAISLSVFSILVLLLYLKMKIRKSEHYYAVLLINGFSERDIAVMILAEAAFILGVSCIIGVISGTFICRVLFYGYRANYLWIVFLYLIGGSLAVFVSLRQYKKIDLSVHLSKEEDMLC